MGLTGFKYKVGDYIKCLTLIEPVKGQYEEIEITGEIQRLVGEVLDGNWYKIKMSDGKTTYISEDNILEIKENGWRKVEE